MSDLNTSQEMENSKQVEETPSLDGSEHSTSIDTNQILTLDYLYRDGLNSENRDLRLFKYDREGHELDVDFPYSIPENLVAGLVGIITEGVTVILDCEKFTVPITSSSQATDFGKKINLIDKYTKKLENKVNTIVSQVPEADRHNITQLVNSDLLFIKAVAEHNRNALNEARVSWLTSRRRSRGDNLDNAEGINDEVVHPAPVEDEAELVAPGISNRESSAGNRAVDNQRELETIPEVSEPQLSPVLADNILHPRTNNRNASSSPVNNTNPDQPILQANISQNPRSQRDQEQSPRQPQMVSPNDQDDNYLSEEMDVEEDQVNQLLDRVSTHSRPERTLDHIPFAGRSGNLNTSRDSQRSNQSISRGRTANTPPPKLDDPITFHPILLREIRRLTGVVVDQRADPDLILLLINQYLEQDLRMDTPGIQDKINMLAATLLSQEVDDDLRTHANENRRRQEAAWQAVQFHTQQMSQIPQAQPRLREVTDPVERNILQNTGTAAIPNQLTNAERQNLRNNFRRQASVLPERHRRTDANILRDVENHLDDMDRSINNSNAHLSNIQANSRNYSDSPQVVYSSQPQRNRVASPMTTRREQPPFQHPPPPVRSNSGRATSPPDISHYDRRRQEQDGFDRYDPNEEPATLTRSSRMRHQPSQSNVRANHTSSRQYMDEQDSESDDDLPLVSQRNKPQQNVRFNDNIRDPGQSSYQDHTRQRSGPHTNDNQTFIVVSPDHDDQCNQTPRDGSGATRQSRSRRSRLSPVRSRSSTRSPPIIDEEEMRPRTAHTSHNTASDSLGAQPRNQSTPARLRTSERSDRNDDRDSHHSSITSHRSRSETAGGISKNRAASVERSQSRYTSATNNKRTSYPYYDEFMKKLKPSIGLEDDGCEYVIPNQPEEPIMQDGIDAPRRIMERYQEMLSLFDPLWANSRIVRGKCEMLNNIRTYTTQEQREICKQINDIEKKGDLLLRSITDFSKAFGIVEDYLTYRDRAQCVDFHKATKKIYYLLSQLIEETTKYFRKFSINASSVTSSDQDNVDWYDFTGDSKFMDKTVYEFLENQILNCRRVHINDAARFQRLKTHLKGPASGAVESYVDSFEQAADILLHRYGNGHELLRDIRSNHIWVGQCPSKLKAVTEDWRSIADIAGKHLRLIERAKHLSIYQPQILPDLTHPSYVLMLCEQLSPEDHEKHFEDADLHPKETFEVVKGIFESNFKKGQKLGKKRNERRYNKDKSNQPTKSTPEQKPNQGPPSTARGLKIVSDTMERSALPVEVRDDPSCVICQIMAEEGHGTELGRNHIMNISRFGARSHPSNCPNYLGKLYSGKERRDFLRKHKLCWHCFRSLGSEHNDEMCQKVQAGKSRCPTCYEDHKTFTRIEQCDAHKNDPRNAKKLKDKREFCADKNIEICMLAAPALDHQNKPDPDVAPFVPYDKRDNMISSIIEMVRKTSVIETLDQDVQSMWIFGQAKGKTRGLNTVYDSGCTGCLVRDELIGTELSAYMYAQDPVMLQGIGGDTQGVRFHIELPVATEDGKAQKTISTDVFAVSKILQKFDDFDLTQAYENMKAKLKPLERKIADRCNIYSRFGGNIDILVGLRLYGWFPTPILQYKGLTLFRSKLQSFDPNCQYSLGGPISVVEAFSRTASGNLHEEMSNIITAATTVAIETPLSIDTQSGAVLAHDDDDATEPETLKSVTNKEG